MYFSGYDFQLIFLAATYVLQNSWLFELISERFAVDIANNRHAILCCIVVSHKQRSISANTNFTLLDNVKMNSLYIKTLQTVIPSISHLSLRIMLVNFIVAVLICIVLRKMSSFWTSSTDAFIVAVLI